jgi:enoyl-CoA hydratase/carnithine racemase
LINAVVEPAELLPRALEAASAIAANAPLAVRATRAFLEKRKPDWKAR